MKKDQQQKPAKNVDEYVPVVLVDMLNDADPAKSRRVMKAMLQMGKIDIKKLNLVYNG